jgi:hypothetical protein
VALGQRESHSPRLRRDRALGSARLTSFVVASCRATAPSCVVLP